MTHRIEPPAEANRWLLAAALAVAIVAFLAFFSAAQVASSGPGERVMARTIADMTEIDNAIPDIQASLREAADQSGVDPIPVPDFPIAVEVSRDTLLSADTDELRDEILTRSAARTYDDGVPVWDDTDPDAQQSIARSSTAGGMQAALGLVGPTPRVIFLALAIISTLGAAALTFALAAPMSALRRLTALGAVLTTAGMLAVLGALLLRLITRAAADDPFADSLADIALDAQNVGLRNAITTSALGLAFVALGVGGGILDERRNSTDGLSFDRDI